MEEFQVFKIVHMVPDGPKHLKDLRDICWT